MTVCHMQHTPALQVSAKQCWISFEPAAHCGKLELHFFNK